MSMTQCQIDAAQNLNKLMSDSGYNYCMLNDELVRLADWYDNDISWASTTWFVGDNWRDRLNQGAFIISTSAMFLFLVVSVLANIKIVHYHLTSSPHPKYSLTDLSKLCIRVHVSTGILGVGLPLYVFFSSDEPSCFLLMCIICAVDYVFATTAFMQTPNVHGVRVFTVPLYYVCVFFKVVINCCLLQSLANNNTGGFKTQVQWLWMVWVVHQTYAWVRIWYMVFSKFDALQAHIYSVSVFMAGAVCIGAVFGVYLFLVWFIAIVLMYLSIGQETCALAAKSELTEKETVRVYALANMWKEWHYNIYCSDVAAAQRGRELCTTHNVDLSSANVFATTPRELKAMILFNTIDLDGNGDISKQELELFLVSFGVVNTSSAAKTLFHGKKSVSLVEFTEHFAVFYEYAFASLVHLHAQHTHPSLHNRLLTMAARGEERGEERALQVEELKRAGASAGDHHVVLEKDRVGVVDDCLTDADTPDAPLSLSEGTVCASV